MDRFLKSSIPQARRNGTSIMNQIAENSAAYEAIKGTHSNPNTSSGRRPTHSNRLHSLMGQNSPQIHPCPQLGTFPLVQADMGIRQPMRAPSTTQHANDNA